MLKPAILSVVAAFGMAQSVAAFELEDVNESKFNEDIVGKTWASTFNDTVLHFQDGGNFAIKAPQGDFVGTWQFEEGKGFCREGTFNGQTVPYDCQPIFMIGDKIAVIISKKNPDGIPYILVD